MTTENLSIWLKNLQNINESSSTEVLGTTVRSLFSDMHNKGSDFVNEKLVQINVQEASPAHLVAVLSSLFNWRNIMTNWKPFRQKMVEEFKRHEIPNIEMALKGLLNN